ncbi:MAG: hypothetical protein K0S27_653 [Gammaproteobacteria bacterium]|jgi:hypothetical protein|nr:hypothetical protein [Gammaproteobacteria bacterium]
MPIPITATLPSLPSAMQQLVLHFLDPKEVAIASRVCKNFRKEVSDYNIKKRGLNKKVAEAEKQVEEAKQKREESLTHIRQEFNTRRLRLAQSTQSQQKQLKEKEEKELESLALEEAIALAKAQEIEDREVLATEENLYQVIKTSSDTFARRIQLLNNFLTEIEETRRKTSWFKGRWNTLTPEELDRKNRELLESRICDGFLFFLAMLMSLTMCWIIATLQPSPLGILLVVLSVVLSGAFFLVFIRSIVIRINFAGPERFDRQKLEIFSEKVVSNIRGIQIEFKDSNDILLSEIESAEEKTVDEVSRAISAARDRLIHAHSRFFNSSDKRPKTGTLQAKNETLEAKDEALSLLFS